MVTLGEVFAKKFQKDLVKMELRHLKELIGEFKKADDKRAFFEEKIEPVLKRLYQILPEEKKQKLYYEVELKLREEFEFAVPFRKVSGGAF